MASRVNEIAGFAPCESHGLNVGANIVRILAGAWRGSAAPLDLTVRELNEAVPLLLGTGAGSLGWRRVARLPVSSSAAAFKLRQAYRHHTLQAAIHEDQLQRLLVRLRKARVEPILCKGWSMARLYAEPGLRPYGDHDLCVTAAETAPAMEVLNEAGGRCGQVDLHQCVPDLRDRRWTEIRARCQEVLLGEVPVRVLGPEDNLRLLCVHFWRHGAMRPLWLCDVAVCLESLPDHFDWDYCLHGSAACADWIRCVVSLAKNLLGARCAGPACPLALHDIPGWLVPAVLWRWCFGIDLPPFTNHLRQPARLPLAIFNRWFNPIRSSYRCLRPAVMADRPGNTLEAFRTGGSAHGQMPRTATPCARGLRHSSRSGHGIKITTPNKRGSATGQPLRRKTPGKPRNH